MKNGVIAAKLGKWEDAAPCALTLLLSAILFGAQLPGGYAPFALGVIAAAGAGRRGLSALLGGILGALAFMNFSHTLRTLAVAVLLYTGNNAFCETRWYRSRFFLPALTVSMHLAVEFVYLLEEGADQAAYCLMSIAIASLTAVYGCEVLRGKETQEERRQRAILMLLTGVLAALSSVRLESGFAPGHIAAMLLVMLLGYDRALSEALPAALGIGLVLDLTAPAATFLHTAAYGFGVMAIAPERRARRVAAVLRWCAPLVMLSLPLSVEEGAVLLYEGLGAALVFLVLPNRLFSGKRLLAAREDETEESAKRSAVQTRLGATALALRELYDSLMRAPRAEEENPAMIFDRAAERVCRGCSLRTICWERDYAKTYNALNDATAALLAQGRGRGGDFPSYFTDRCIRFPSFLAAVNAEVSSFLLRRQYRGRLAEARAQAAGQYAQISELLHETAEHLEVPAAMCRDVLHYRVGAAMRPKEGERVSGDSMAHFETEDGALCLLLSDGMGCGEAARRESALAVRLLERFLRAGVEAPSALKTLNSALTLRGELSESFTTLDLLRLPPGGGAAEVYKYGGAPSYVKRGRSVRRVTGSCLPAGLQAAGTQPETTRVRLEKGNFFVMLTDGVADVNDDAWLQTLLERWQGSDPQALAQAILAASGEKRGTTDDASVLVLALDGNSAPQEV